MPKPYPKKFREDVVRLARNRKPGVTVEQIAADFGVHPFTLSKWLRRADTDEGARPVTASSESAEARSPQAHPAAGTGERGLAAGSGVSVAGEPVGKMMYPLVRELAAAADPHAERPGHVRPDVGKTELGHPFLPQAWGHGYATEACTAALDWFADALPGEAVVLRTQTANERSLRLAAKLGFTEVERHEEYGAEQRLGVWRPATPSDPDSSSITRSRNSTTPSTEPRAVATR
ncbi:GNAT family N-acetyltransferase [Streptomyces diacarni]|uniref:GNAT family N-acetyltransferase n=1 Tax=Streptomyces diacarni TaxID=2800381 RepID=A0A367EIX6_9ACTN|nr:GNAT family N-acetyltransferase [Streptomyces diacarni]RCG17709.1 GNAT family N-acetyltransferase [Streptomyces diacarni]